MEDILKKILYGIKVANDNVIVLNEKIEAILKAIGNYNPDACENPE